MIAKNRMKIPYEIEINVDTFNETTTDGHNEPELIEKFNALVDSEKQQALQRIALTGFEKFCLFGGIAIAVIGLLMLNSGSAFMGIIAVIAGIGMVIKLVLCLNSEKTADGWVFTQMNDVVSVSLGYDYMMKQNSRKERV